MEEDATRRSTQQQGRKKRRKVEKEKEREQNTLSNGVAIGLPESFCLQQHQQGRSDNPTYFVSMPTGLEAVTIEEINYKLDPIAVFSPFSGKVVFTTISKTPLQVSQCLRSVDKLYVCVDIVKNVVREKEKGLAYLESLAKSLEWEPSIETWRRCNPLQQPPQHNEGGINDKQLSFRVTFHRANSVSNKNVPRDTRREAEYSSMEGAGWFGGGVHEKLNWIVNLKEYDVEVRNSLIFNKLELTFN